MNKLPKSIIRVIISHVTGVGDNNDPIYTSNTLITLASLRTISRLFRDSIQAYWYKYAWELYLDDPKIMEHVISTYDNAVVFECKDEMFLNACKTANKNIFEYFKRAHTGEYNALQNFLKSIGIIYASDGRSKYCKKALIELGSSKLYNTFTYYLEQYLPKIVHPQSFIVKCMNRSLIHDGVAGFILGSMFFGIHKDHISGNADIDASEISEETLMKMIDNKSRYVTHLINLLFTASMLSSGTVGRLLCYLCSKSDTMCEGTVLPLITSHYQLMKGVKLSAKYGNYSNIIYIITERSNSFYECGNIYTVLSWFIKYECVEVFTIVFNGLIKRKLYNYRKLYFDCRPGITLLPIIKIICMHHIVAAEHDAIKFIYGEMIKLRDFVSADYIKQKYASHII